MKETAAKYAKSFGIRSLAEVSKITGVSAQTLTNWHKHKPELFRVVIAGCIQLGETKRIGMIEHRLNIVGLWQRWVKGGPYEAIVKDASLPMAASALLESGYLVNDNDVQFVKKVISSWEG